MKKRSRSQFNKTVALEGEFSESMVVHFRSERDLAKDHVIGRNRRVGILLCYLSLMRGHDLIPANAKVFCGAAWYYDFESSDDNEAAHYLPGQIIINDHDPSYYVTDSRTKNGVGELFSREQDLPIDFNKADSYVEQYTRPGLRQLLAEACRNVIRDKVALPNRVSPVVWDCFNEWIAKSLKAYGAAINRKTDIADLEENPIPPGNEPAMPLEPHLYRPERADFYERAVRKNRKGEITATIWDYSQQIRILEYYAEFTAGFELTKKIVEDVKSTFKG